MNERNWAIRTVKKGRVQVYGKMFKPQDNHREYDGRLDGLRFAFGRYKDYATSEGYLPMITLWGTEAAFKNPDLHGWGPELVDGTFPWQCWDVDSDVRNT